jgi:hypothetical protein
MWLSIILNKMNKYNLFLINWFKFGTKKIIVIIKINIKITKIIKIQVNARKRKNSDL